MSLYFVIFSAFSSQGTNLYLAFSAFISRQISFLKADKTFVFFMVYVLLCVSHYTDIIKFDQKPVCLTQLKFLLFGKNLLMTHSKAKLRINDYKTSHVTSAVQTVSNVHKTETVKPYRAQTSGDYT
jgi:hypothetical protein